MNYLTCYNSEVMRRAMHPEETPQLPASITFDSTTTMYDLILSNPRLFGDKPFAIMVQHGLLRPYTLVTAFEFEMTGDAPSKSIFCGTWMEFIENLKTLAK